MNKKGVSKKVLTQVIVTSSKNKAVSLTVVQESSSQYDKETRKSVTKSSGVYLYKGKKRKSEKRFGNTMDAMMAAGGIKC